MKDVLDLASRAFPLLAALAFTGCNRDRSSPSGMNDASAARERIVRVPGAVMISHGLDSLSVSVDPSALVETTVTVDPGMTLGVETRCFVFPSGKSRPPVGRRGVVPSVDSDTRFCSWTSTTDGLPVPGTKYVADLDVVLFETDVPPKPGWDPRAGRFKALWERTLRQAEE